MTLKQKLLAYFTDHQGEIHSGEELAGLFDVTRAAVWKAVSSLKKENIVIDSVPGKGYCYSNINEPLNESLIKQSAGSDFPLILLDSVDSTNNYAKKLVIDGCTEGTMIIADRQTSGRGRNGKSFYSPSGTGLYVSYIFSCCENLHNIQYVTMAAAVAAAEAVEACSKDHVRIKWFNDLYSESGKIGGILTEATFDLETMSPDKIITGIGINCRTESFPDDLKEKAGSLSDPALSRNRLAGELYKHLNTLMHSPDLKHITDAYRSYSLLSGREITYLHNGIEKRGHVKTINDDGSVTVSSENKDLVYTAKEITILHWK